MWLGFVERNGSTEAGLTAAEGAKEALSITDADTERLPAWARYNLLRRGFGQAIAASASGPGKADARRAAIDTFLKGVDGLGAAVASEPSVSALTAQLKPLLDKSADLDLSKLGPGASGWKAAPVSDDGKSVSYTWTRGGTTHTLQFQRLAGTDDTVSFMGTTEVPVGLFIDAVTGAGKWDEVKPLLASYPAGGYDTRSGPRVWEWSTRPGQVMSVAAPWSGGHQPRLAPHQVNNIRPGVLPAGADGDAANASASDAVRFAHRCCLCCSPHGMPATDLR